MKFACLFLWDFKMFSLVDSAYQVRHQSCVLIGVSKQLINCALCDTDNEDKSSKSTVWH